MADHLAEWVSNKPELIEELKDRPLLEHMLRRIKYQPTENTESDEQWNQIVKSLTQ